ncbi:MAG: extracellular solute-binding protein [Planctomycetota bacterium]|nr:extracellular solute-binding protein [Planctomycetota bacterium]MDA1105798.1 extracellular solute-binding protein [Planctomycetota bacterium]
MIRGGLVVGLVFVVAMLAGCGDAGVKPSSEFIVYASADEPVARAVVDAFTAQTDIPVVLHLDTEASKTTGLAERIRREATHPVADVFWSSEHTVMDQLAAEDLLAPLGLAVPDAWPADLIGGGGRWAGFAGRCRVLVFPADAAPPPAASMESIMLALRSGERLALADPRFGTTRGHLMALAGELVQARGVDAWNSWCERLAGTNPLILTGGNAAVVDAVASGDAALGITDTDDALAAIAGGRKIQFQVIALLDGEGPCGAGSAFIIPNTVGIVRGNDSPRDAEAFARFLLGESVETMLAQSASANIPLGSGATPPAGLALGMPCLLSPSATRAALASAAIDPLSVLQAALRDASGTDG